jgi:glutathione S-transferase
MLPILYSSYNCPHSLKVAFFLSEKGIEFRRIEVDLSTREQKTKDYLAINHHGTVPAYEDENGVIGDSLEIMRYADLQAKSTQLFPDNPNQFADILKWVERGNTDFWDVSHHLYWQLIQPPHEGTDWETVKLLKDKGLRLLQELEDILKVQPYIIGTLSAADNALLPWVYGYKRFDLLQPGHFPAVESWLAELSQRQTFTANYRVKGLALKSFLTEQQKLSSR